MLKINSVFFVTVVIAILSNFSIDYFVPTLPFIAANFNSTIIQLAVGIYLFGAGIGQLIYGPFSDYFGRKKILLIGIAVGILGSISCSYAPTAFVLLLGRFVQGLGLASCLSMMRSILRDCYSKNNISKYIRM